MRQGFQFFPAHDVEELENGYGLMAGRRHYTKVVMPLQPPIIYGRLPQVVEGEMVNPSFPPTSSNICPIDFIGSPFRVNTFTSNHPRGIVLQIVSS